MPGKFDIIIIGGGAGGLFAASVANALGAKTCLIDKEKLGGDCTWFGCMPSKALLKSAHVANYFKKAREFGLNLSSEPVFDTSKVMDHVQSIIEEISTHHPAETFEKRGITVRFGKVKFTGNNIIELNRDKLIAKRFIICTGSHPVVPPIKGLGNIRYLTNETIFNSGKLPESLIVLGGGPIGIELSQALNRLGVKISIVEMMDRILFREDKEISSVVETTLKKEGIKIYTGRKAVEFTEENNHSQASAVLENKKGEKETISAGNILVAVGRAPNLEGLSLDKAGVTYDKKGIKTNHYLQTSNPHIFACGDIVGPYMFSHVAAYQASICVRNALFRKLVWKKTNYDNVSWATFTEPEIAHLGLTEEEAKQKYKTVKIYKTEYSGSDRAVTDLEKEGLVKVITDKKGYIIGAGIVGAKAGEIIHNLVIAKSAKIPFHKLGLMLFTYPTLSELIKKTAAKPLIEKADNPFVKIILKVTRKI